MSIPESIEQLLVEAELLAEEVLTEKQQIIELDRRHNTNREAINALKRSSGKEGDKVWINLGDIFIQMPASKTKQNLEKEQEKIAKEIDQLRNGLKMKTQRLYQMEGKEDALKGFFLKGMSPEDMKFVQK
eukprot:TRINITY_DN4706_c0_g1_i1.p1 TRINITY_DN4706_c0_g1~~TRINITY_DN4706_c0_g1_i1.p1  ORF type:complete len:130 (-),score=38.81 TRINITY_DN4706_c0_g1_i1:596-985(-)